MNKDILNTGVQEFIQKNIDTDIVSLLLKKSIFEKVSLKELAEQIESKKKCIKKLPTWFKTRQIYYPSKLNIEQTSSELSAQYKSKIVSGKSLVDLTGGFGIDSHFFAQKVSEVFHCEIDACLAKIASHNFKILGSKNVTTIPGDGLQFLKNSSKKFDWLYIDPSRRNDKKGKVYHLSDCEPDVTRYLDLFFASADNILLKIAPFLDVSAGTKDLNNTKEIHIVAVNGEVKELLWVLEKNCSRNIQVKTVNLGKDHSQVFTFFNKEEKEVDSSFDLPLNYLYEPNAAIMKSGGFKTVGNRFSLAKIHRHTHLYTSIELIDFPGRRFVIEEYLPYDKKARDFLNGMKANVSTRNFPKTVAEIRKKYKIRDGGKIFLFFVTDLNDKLIVLKCKRLTQNTVRSWSKFGEPFQ